MIQNQSLSSPVPIRYRTFSVVPELAVELRESISANGVPRFRLRLQRLFDEPLDDGEDLDVVEALDLMWFESVGALHARQSADDLLRKRDLGADGGIFLEEEIHVHVDAADRDAPSHPAHDLVKVRETLDASPEVTCRGKSSWA